MSDKPLKHGEFDWYPVRESVAAMIRSTLSQRPKLTAAITFAEGQDFIENATSSILAAVREHFEEPEQ